MDKWIDDYRKGDHAIHEYSSDYDFKKVIIDIADWADRDEKIIWLNDKLTTEKAMGSNMRADSRFDSDLRKGRVEIRASYDSYCPGGEFLRSKMFEYWGNTYRETLKEGYKGLFVIGDVTWLGSHASLFDSFMRYEQAIDFARIPGKITILCQYDKRVFTEDQLRAAENVHQLHLKDGRLERSYWFVLRRALENASNSESANGPSVISESFVKQI